jgi:hypothetical protein
MERPVVAKILVKKACTSGLVFKYKKQACQAASACVITLRFFPARFVSVFGWIIPCSSIGRRCAQGCLRKDERASDVSRLFRFAPPLTMAIFWVTQRQSTVALAKKPDVHPQHACQMPGGE